MVLRSGGTPVRLATLLHDLGHPPFSHIVELALERDRKRRYPDHEVLSRQLLRAVITEDNDVRLLGHAALLVAAQIFDEKNTAKGSGPLHGIATLFSGDLDADRIDYVRRDGHTTGFGGPRYDIARLVDSARLVAKGGRPRLEFLTDCLSTVEAFFLARLHLYRWTIWHHNALRTDLALTRAVHLLLTMPARLLPPAGREARSWIEGPLKKPTTDAYQDFDDAGLLYHLRQIRKAIRKNSPGALGDLELLLDVFLYRRKDRLTTLWKTADEYGRLAGAVYPSDDRISAVRRLNKRWRDLHKTRFEGDVQRFEEAVEKALRATGQRYLARYLWRFRPAPEKIKLRTRDGARVPLTELSPAVMALNEAWMGMPHLWLFVVGGGKRVGELAAPELEILAKSLREFISWKG